MTAGTFNAARSNTLLAVAAATIVGALRQLPDGRAGIMLGLTAAASGDSRSFTDAGKYVFTKTAGVVLLGGGRAYLDYSADAITYKKVGDRDFYVGRVVGDAASADTTCVVDLNVDPPYDLDLVRDPYSTAPIGTQALGGLLPPRPDGGALDFFISTVNEAQKLDAMGVDTFSKLAKTIVEFAFRVLNDGAGTVVDVNLGIANTTNVTDADAIANHLFVHLDANVTKINLQSKDGTTTVAATDTTLTYTEGSAIANRVEVWFDLRDPTNVKCYVNAVRALPNTVFRLDAAANELRLLAHIEKTAAADAYELALDWARSRFQE